MSTMHLLNTSFLDQPSITMGVLSNGGGGGGWRNNEKILPIHFIFLLHIRGRCGHDRMVVGFTTTYAISLSPLKL